MDAIVDTSQKCIVLLQLDIRTFFFKNADGFAQVRFSLLAS